MPLRCSKCGRWYKQRTMSLYAPDLCDKCGCDSLPRIVDSQTTKEDITEYVYEDDDSDGLI